MPTLSLLLVSHWYFASSLANFKLKFYPYVVDDLLA